MKESEKIILKGKLNTYIKWPLLGTLFFVILTIFVFPVDALAGMIVMVFGLIYFCVSLIIMEKFKADMTESLIGFASAYSQVQKKMLKNLDVPYALLDETGRIIWGNKLIEEIFPDAVRNRDNIIALVGDEKDVLDFGEKNKTETEIVVDDKTYKVVFKPFDMNSVINGAKDCDLDEKTDMVGMYLYDISDYKAVETKLKDDQVIFGHIYIDNYDEVFQNIETAKRVVTTGVIDRKIAQYFGKYDGVVRKIDNDKYFIMTKAKHMSSLQSDKFSILDEVRESGQKSNIDATISIGLGMGSETLAGSVELANMSIDLALGRGGDQAVLRDGNKVYYYGGKSKSVEKNTKVKSRIKATAFRELLLDKEEVYIMGHHIADNDAFGAAIGFYRIAKTLGKPAHIVIGEYTNSVKPLVKYFKDSEDYEEDMFLSGGKALDKITKRDILIVVDCSSASYSEEPKLVNRAQAKVVIDHHRQREDVIDDANLTYIEPSASSACEIVTEIMQYTNEVVKLTAKEADTMYAGILVDTNNFTRRVGSRTFESAAYLRKKGADVANTNNLFRNDIEDYKAKADTISNTEIYKDRFAIAVCEAKNVESPTVVGAQVANDLLTVKGVKASFVLTPYGEQVYISARSVDNINVQVLMEEFNGGGHMTLAGAQVKTTKVEDVEKDLKKLISKKIKDGDL